MPLTCSHFPQTEEVEATAKKCHALAVRGIAHPLPGEGKTSLESRGQVRLSTADIPLRIGRKHRGKGGMQWLSAGVAAQVYIAPGSARQTSLSHGPPPGIR